MCLSFNEWMTSTLHRWVVTWLMFLSDVHASYIGNACNNNNAKQQGMWEIWFFFIVTVMIIYSSTRQSYIVTVSKPYSTGHRVPAYSWHPYCQAGIKKNPCKAVFGWDPIMKTTFYHFMYHSLLYMCWHIICENARHNLSDSHNDHLHSPVSCN